MKENELLNSVTNPKIEKARAEIAKTKARIAELQAKLREQEHNKRVLEDFEIVTRFRRGQKHGDTPAATEMPSPTTEIKEDNFDDNIEN